MKAKPSLFTHKNLARLMTVLILGLSLMAGYYQLLFKSERRKYLQLEDKYVRVRDQLGRDETQRLIDQSHQP